MNEVLGGPDLKGKIALVTGGSRGIGRAISEAFANAGARVAIMDLDGEGASAAAASLPGEGHSGHQGNVADQESATEIVKQVQGDLGTIDILVNNAGITRDNLLLRMKDEEFDDVIEVNLKGTFNLTRAVGRGMLKQRSGVILNIASVVGLMGNAGQANYAASKAGVIGFTKSVARELAPRGVRCNAIAPGFIRTDMTDALTEDQIEALQSQIPLARLGEPNDISGVALFLVSPAACYITGQVLAVDGGMVM
jgi:3-oxoacyl-[acyl-carrier protein] reductase